MFVDTHCHLNMLVEKKLDEKIMQEHLLTIKKIIEQAKNAGVGKIITIGTSLQECLNSILIAKHFDNVFAAVGIHPCDCSDFWKKDFEEIKKLVKEKELNKIVGIGETGLDFYHKPFNVQRQIDAFKTHIEFALECDLPLVIHVRDAGQETLKVLDEYKKEIKGVFHCFSQDKDFAKSAFDWGMYVGITGPITYPKNQEFRDMVAQFPIEKILFETDAPFLPPQQFRGKQNLPAYLPIFAQVLADLKGINIEKIEEITTKNAQNLFKI